MKIFITEQDEIHPKAIKLLQENNFGLLTESNKFTAQVLFLRTYTQATANYLSQFSQLKFVLRAGVGLDNIDLEYCQKRGIKVINAPGSNANAVAEFVIGVILMQLRQLVPQMTCLKQGKWRNSAYLGQEIRNKKLGLIGCGAIGQLIVKKLSSWELAEIYVYDPFLSQEQIKEIGCTKTSLSKLLAESDIVSLHLPLTNQTRNLISLEQFEQMKNSCLLINTARGGIVNEQDLVTAIEQGMIESAMLDVFSTEPEISTELVSNKKILSTPHIAAYTEEAYLDMCVAPVKRLLQLFY